MTSSLRAEGLVWGNDLEAARQAAAASNRLVLVHVGATWCSPCQRLEKEVFSRPGFGAALEPMYVAVKLDRDRHSETAKALGVGPIPADVVMTPDGRILALDISPQTANEYTARLALVWRQAMAASAQIAAIPQPVSDRAAAEAAHSASHPQQPSAPAAADASRPPWGATNVSATQGSAGGWPPPPQAAPTNAECRPQSNMAATPAASSQSASTSQGTAATLAVDAHRSASSPTAQSADATVTADAARNSTLPQIPPGNPPLALEGYCCVTLRDHGQWQPGDVRYGMRHRGRTYLFTHPDAVAKFREDPDYYAPVMGGLDPVLALDQQIQSPGNRAFGGYFHDRLYLFSSESSLQRFEQQPARYSAEVLQAMR